MRKPTNILQSLEFRPFVAGFRAESAALWFLCFYIMLEYIRPQSMYPVLDILPWGQVAILSCVASVFITRNKAIGFGAMDKMFIAFSILVVMSALFAWSLDASFKHWTTYASWVLLYFCVVSILTTPNRILLFTLFFILINFKLSQHGARSFAMRGFSFASYGLTGPPGWFNNSGEYGLQMVVMFSICLSLILAFRDYISSSFRWWVLIVLFPVTAALTVIGSSSRGAQIALAVVIIPFVLKGGRFLKKSLLIIAIVLAVLYFLPEDQLARFDTMGEDETSQLRLIHWENAMDVLDNNPMGIGYKNWRQYYKEHYDIEKVEEIHNTILEAFVELGYPGGILFLIMVFSSFVMNIKTKNEMNNLGGVEGKSIAAIAVGVNMGLLGTLIAAFFISLLYYPVFWLAFSMTSALRNISKNYLKEKRSSLLQSENKFNADNSYCSKSN